MYYGMVRGASIAMATRSITQDLGLGVGSTTNIHVPVAFGVGSRRGLGKVRRDERNQVQLQEKSQRG
eukprot:11183415-Lingulodinium_polyedra.AAC.1